MNIKLKDRTILPLETLLKNIIKDTRTYKLIENPSEELTLKILKNNAFVIALIENPTEEMCLTAVRTDFKSLEGIKNKNLILCLEALNNFKSSMKFRSGVKNHVEGEKLASLIPFVEPSSVDDCLEKVQNKIKLLSLIDGSKQ